MKVLSILALVGVALAASTQDRNRAFEDTIIDFIECVRGEMNVGWPDFGIPDLNPLEITDHTFDLNSLGVEGIGGELNVQNLVFSGLNEFVYENIQGNIGLLPPSYTIKLDLIFPNPKLDTDYSGAIQLANIGIDTFGTGTLSLEANNFKASVDLKAELLGRLKLDYIDLWISMEPLTSFTITGIRDDEDYSAELSADILANGVAKIEELAGPIHDLVADLATDLINNGEGGEEGGFLAGIIDRCLGIY